MNDSDVLDCLPYKKREGQGETRVSGSRSIQNTPFDELRASQSRRGTLHEERALDDFTTNQHKLSWVMPCATAAPEPTL